MTLQDVLREVNVSLFLLQRWMRGREESMEWLENALLEPKRKGLWRRADPAALLDHARARELVHEFSMDVFFLRGICHLAPGATLYISETVEKAVTSRMVALCGGILKRQIALLKVRRMPDEMYQRAIEWKEAKDKLREDLQIWKRLGFVENSPQERAGFFSRAEQDFSLEDRAILQRAANIEPEPAEQVTTPAGEVKTP